MNKREIRTWLNEYVAKSLRRKAQILTTGDMAMKAKQGDVTKAKRAMLEMAERLSPLEVQTVEPEAKQPVPSGGKDHLPEEPDETAGRHAPPSER